MMMMMSRKTWLDHHGPNSTGNESKKKTKHNTRGSRRSCLNGPRLTPPEGLQSTKRIICSQRQTFRVCGRRLRCEKRSNLDLYR